MTSDPLRLALGTLTTVPVPAPRSVGPRTAGWAMALAPVAAVPLAVVAAAVALACHLLSLPGPVSGGCVIGALAIATRGMHLDGLADSADGLAASYDRERALTVMRTGDVGPAGAATLTLVLLVQAGALATIISTDDLARLVVAPLIALLASRATLACCCLTGVPSARPDGLGATVAGTVPRRGVLGVLLVVAAATAGAGAVGGWPWWVGPVTVLVCTVTAVVVVRRSVSRLGGITGDVLGACVELAFTAALVTLVAVPAA